MYILINSQSAFKRLIPLADRVLIKRISPLTKVFLYYVSDPWFDRRHQGEYYYRSRIYRSLMKEKFWQLVLDWRIKMANSLLCLLPLETKFFYRSMEDYSWRLKVKTFTCLEMMKSLPNIRSSVIKVSINIWNSNILKFILI